jgi:dUTP pyrophosphatase
MLLSDSKIRALVEKGLLVRDMIDPKTQIQQCGIDLTVAKVFSFKGEGVLDFDNKKRKIPDYVEIKPKKEGGEEFWLLAKGVYHIAFNETIALPKNIAGLLFPRSSALSCGIVEHTAVWDPGYEGRSFFHAEVSRPVKIYKNARLGQMIFFYLSEDASVYSGIYNGEELVKFAKRGKHAKD